MARTTSSKKRAKKTLSSWSTGGGSTKRMSASSKSGSKKSKRGKAIDRPMDRALLKRAGKIADQYRIMLEPDEDCGYVGYSLELPGALGDGKTPDACVRSVREAATVLIAYYFEEGRIPPSPATQIKRTEQINIRVTEEEKLRMEAAARRNGFRGVSDFVRSASLTNANQR